MLNTQDTESRLVQGILRLAKVVEARTSSIAVAQGISPLQLGILSFLAGRYSGVPVSVLARRFMVTLATVSDSLRVLEEKELVTKSRHPDDARLVLIAITDVGSEVGKASAAMADTVRRIVSDWNGNRRAEVFPAIVELIDGLRREEAAPVDRVCAGCRHFAINCESSSQSAPYYCRFYATPLHAVEMQIDCPDFESR